LAQWYYTQYGQQAGPVDEAQLKALVTAGHVGPADMAWKDGMANWQAVSSLPDLAGQIASQPAGASGQYPQQANPGVYPQPAYTAANPAAVNYYTPEAPATVGYAGFWMRCAAWIIDYLIVGIPMIIFGFVVGLGLGAAGMNMNDPSVALGMQSLNLVSIVVFWLYWALQESSARQATVGKRVLGLRVVDMNGQRITFGRASGRFFGKIVSGIICAVGYMMAGFTERKQALHDIMASTLVIRT
jgi:uncharacterized RDD family membrane protein YckC